MTGSCWRLLAAFSLIFVVPMFLRGQDGAADRPPILAPTLSPPRYSLPIAPVWTPVSPSPPGRYPVGLYPVGHYPGAHYPVAPDPVAPGTIVFQRMVRAAGIIFSGRVTFVGRAASSPGPDPASTTVTFQVERAMRGASPGQSLTIREWAGRWTSGEHYRVGERVLLFLYSPSKLGLTSPVAGAVGRFAVDFQGKIVMSAQHVETFAADPILGGKTVVPYADFALAVRCSSREE
jgi:hypothetical protein